MLVQMRFRANHVVITNHVGWTWVQYLFTDNNISKPAFVSLLTQTKKIIWRKLRWILDTYYSSYHVRRTKCFSLIYRCFRSNPGILKLLSMSKISILFEFKFQFFAIFEKCCIFSICHVSIPHYYIQDYEIIRVL